MVVRIVPLICWGVRWIVSIGVGLQVRVITMLLYLRRVLRLLVSWIGSLHLLLILQGVALWVSLLVNLLVDLRMTLKMMTL